MKPTDWKKQKAKQAEWIADRPNLWKLRNDFPAVQEVDPFAGEHQDDIDGLTWWARIKQYWSGLWK